MDFSHPARLWAARAPRTVCLLRNGQVELVWDRVVVALRRTDLIVLNRTLRHWQHETQPDAADTYLVMLDDCRIAVRAEEMAQFSEMVADAVDQLPRTFVRWADLRVRIVPFPTASSVDSDLYSLN